MTEVAATTTNRGGLIPYREDLAQSNDELFANIQKYAIEYDKQRTAEKEAEAAKKAASDALNAALAVLAITEGEDPDLVDGIVLTPIDPQGQQSAWQRTKRAGQKKISASRLLEKGVSADVIQYATEEGQSSESWSVSVVKAETLAKKVLG